MEQATPALPSSKLAPRRLREAALAMLILAACGGSSPGGGETAAPSSPTTPSPTASLEESVALPGLGFEVAIECWGEGSPTTILETGSASAGLTDFSASFMREIGAEGGTVCAYDRVGTGASERPPPRERRTIHDQTDELHALIGAAGLRAPYVLVGSSWGGFVVLVYAEEHPDDIGAIVLLDVPAANPNLTAEEAPEAAWDHAANPEQVDFIAAEHELGTRKPVIPPVPLRVVTATLGQSDVEDQSYWMSLSPLSVSVELEGGHDIYQDDPEGVVAEIHEAIGQIGG